MAKSVTGPKRQSRVDVTNMSQKDKDFLTLDPKDVMKKYKLQKQSVYDRRFALNKKIKQAGLSLDEILGNAAAPAESAPAPSAPEPKAASEPAPKRGRPKKVQEEEKPKAKRGRPKRVQENIAEPEKTETPVEEKAPENRDVMVMNKPVPQVPVIMKPIEITFDNFSLKLNGVPKKISVNPDTNAIEIDL